MKPISTENLKRLPSPIELKRICKSLSALEAILCQDWQYRYYSYQKEWSETEEVCEMRNGCGDQMLILFIAEGVCINGFAHESKMNGWRKEMPKEKESFWGKLFRVKKEITSKSIQKNSHGVLEGLPKKFNNFIFGEPIKSIGTTFCIWQTKTDNEWQTGEISLPNDEYKDGSSDLLQLLDGKPTTFQNWAEDYYEKEINIEAVEKVFGGEIITKELVNVLNSELEVYEKLKSDLEEIGYRNQL